MANSIYYILGTRSCWTISNQEFGNQHTHSGSDLQSADELCSRCVVVKLTFSDIATQRQAVSGLFYSTDKSNMNIHYPAPPAPSSVQLKWQKKCVIFTDWGDNLYRFNFKIKTVVRSMLVQFKKQTLRNIYIPILNFPVSHCTTHRVLTFSVVATIFRFKWS